MPVMDLSPSHHERRKGLPRLRAVNVLWDGAVGAFFGRPALIEIAELGTGPIRGMFAQAGLFEGDRFIYSGGQLFRGAAIIYTGPGSGAVRFAGGEDGDADCLVWCDGGQVWRYDGTAVTQVDIPDATDIFDVVYFGSRFVFFAANGRFYFSGINDPETIDGDSFETAEARPDGFLRAVVSGNQMFVFGPETVEVFYLSGDVDAPYAPDTGARLDFGAYSSDLVHQYQGRVWFVSATRQVIALGSGQIGDDSVLEALGRAELGETSLCTILVDGQPLLVLTDKVAGSFVFDGARWYRWHRTGRASLNIAGALNVGAVSYAGDMSSGKVYRLDNRLHADTGAAIERVVSCYRPLSGGRVRNVNVMLQCARGAGSLAVPEPSVEMRYSDDMATWSEWAIQPLGGHGQYGQRPVWRALGHMRPPGRVYEFRCCDDVEFAPQAAVADEVRV